jgi:hypothetical protein
METFARRLILTWLVASFVLGALYIARTGGFAEFLNAPPTEQLKLFVSLPMIFLLRLFITAPASVSIVEAWAIIIVTGVAVFVADSQIPQLQVLSISKMMTTSLFFLTVPAGILALLSVIRNGGVSADGIFWLGAALTFAGARESDVSRYPAARVIGWVILLISSLFLYQLLLAQVIGANLHVGGSGRELFVLFAGFVAFARSLMGSQGNTRYERAY